MNHTLVDSIDFLNETVGARIGVKRGDKEMSAEQIAAAQKLAREWLQTH